MNKYTDTFGLYHDRPTQDGYISGNPFIYTAYAKKIGLDIDEYDIKLAHELTKKFYTNKVFYIRHPFKPETSPVSREEILGRVYLKCYIDLKNWNFSPYIIPPFSLKTLLKQLWELRPTLEPITWRRSGSQFKLTFKHRNYFWINNLNQLYRFAFSVPIQDRYFILKCQNNFNNTNPIHLFYDIIAKIDSFLPKKSGIKWLKYGGEKNKIVMMKEFSEDHPIVIGAK